jgi:hypothetical protein
MLYDIIGDKHMKSYFDTLSDTAVETFDTWLKLVEDLKVPLSSRIAVEIPDEKTIVVIIVLKNFVGFRVKEKYESLIRDRIKNYIGLKVDVLMFEQNKE